MIGRRVIQLRQPPQPPSAAAASPAASPSPSSSCFWRLASRPPAGADPAAELADAERALLDYLNVGPGRPRLAELARGWAAADARYRSVAAALPGARMLRQAPLECLFSFVCSSNNHISRIHGMVERLCSAYGSRLEREPWPELRDPPAGLPACILEQSIASAGAASAWLLLAQDGDDPADVAECRDRARGWLAEADHRCVEALFLDFALADSPALLAARDAILSVQRELE